MESKTITVNGTVYDAVTGMPVDNREKTSEVAPPVTRRAKSSHHVHSRIQASKAANRRAEPAAPAIQKRSEARKITPVAQQKSPVINRFAPQPSKAIHRPRTMNDITPAVPHPLAQKAESRLQSHHQERAPAAVKPSQILKQEAIDKALDQAPHHRSNAPKHKSSRPRAFSFASVALSLLLLTGYLTYINLPNLSVRVAANQAGINAEYPGYRPDGYRLAGINYDTGSVSLKFAANAGPQNFTLTQQQTSWDSTAVKENYVKAHWGDNVVPYSERGLTIYANEGNAVWVNGGILYTITGDAPLSASQVRSIATSM